MRRSIPCLVAKSSGYESRLFLISLFKSVGYLGAAGLLEVCQVIYPTTPGWMFKSLWKNRVLVRELIRRDVVGRYRGSVLGIFWSMVQPLLMLSVYTLVFTQVFRARWHGSVDASEIGFALNLFAGLLVFNVFSECANRAPSAIISHANYVTRVVFPLEIIPLVQLGASLFHAFLSLLILVAANALFNHSVMPTLVLAPLVFVPLALFCLGCSWLLAATGVYWRDIGQLVGVVVTGLLFVSPVFFPAEALPERWRFLAEWNPLAYPIGLLRTVVLAGGVPSLPTWLASLLFCLVWAWGGYFCFQRLRSGFADVL